MPRGRASSRPGKVARYAALVGGETGEASPSESGSFGAEDRGDEAHIAGSESGAQPSPTASVQSGHDGDMLDESAHELDESAHEGMEDEPGVVLQDGLAWDCYGQGESAAEISSVHKYVGEIRRVFGQSTNSMPPGMRVQRELDIETAVFPMPDWHDSTGKTPWLHMHRTGFARVASPDEAPRFVWFCTCCPKSDTAWSMIQMYHQLSACTQDIESAKCLHTEALQLMCSEAAVDMMDFIQDSEASTTGMLGLQTQFRDESESFAGDQTPVFLLASVHKFLHGEPLDLVQVGFFGDLALESGLVLKQSCKVCRGHKRCVHTRLAKRFAGDDLPEDDGEFESAARDEDIPPLSPWKMTEAEFERAFRKQANPDGSGPKLNCISRRQIPFHPQDYSGSAASARYDRNLLDWKTSAGLRDPPSQEFHDSCEYTLNPDPSFLVHSGGVIPYVATYARVENGVFLEFDGVDLGILVFSRKLLFTHEFLQEFWDQTCESRNTHKGWIRGKMKGWKRANFINRSQMPTTPLIDANKQLVLDLLAPFSFQDRIMDALYDYLALLDIDYDKLFQCQCNLSEETMTYVTGIYDNACKWHDYLLLRFPSMAQQLHFIIDAMHAAGHVRCSPFYNHKIQILTKQLNALLNEQKNRIINYMKSSAVYMGQIRALPYIRYHIAMLNLDQIICVRLNGLMCELETIAVVFDGVKVGVNTRLFWPQRSYELPWDVQPQMKPRDMVMGSKFETRAMIPNHLHRATLFTLVTDRVGVQRESFDDLWEWMETTRPCLLPFVKVRDGPNDLVSIDKSGARKTLVPLLLHWSTVAPETVLMPVPLIPIFSRILNSDRIDGHIGISVEDANNITRWSSALSVLLKHGHAFEMEEGDQDVLISMDDDVGWLVLSPAVEVLLRVVLVKAQATFKSESRIETKPWPPIDHVFRTWPAWERMIRTAFFGPSHPVIRQLPTFRLDHVNQLSRDRRKVARSLEDEALLDDLLRQSEVKGLTCNKYKEKVSSRISSGLFTGFCVGCSVCVFFELMADVESPQTAFNMFSLHAWSAADLKAHNRWMEEEIWEDPMTLIPSKLRESLAEA